MRTTIAKYAMRSAPRYTSYPTAPHFEKDFSPEVARHWLASLDAGAPISAYIHVPFCRRMCWYCGCNMKLAARPEPVTAYVDRLLDEIDLVAAAAPSGLLVDQVHFGGGTPTAAPSADLRRVAARLRERFDMLAGAEIAIEVDPRTLEPEMVDALAEIGVTRVSFGVQEFNPGVQAAINRIQPAEMVAEAAAQFRGAGVSSVNFDLIYGLPRQTAAMVAETARAAAAMRPDRIALFGYAHVPWMAKNQRMIDAAELPGAEARVEQAETAAETLQAEGYVPIGIDHFALPEDALAGAAAEGRLKRNFQGYTTDAAETLIGFGATSIGRYAQGYAQNITETGAWGRAVAEGVPPVARGFAFAGEDLVRAAVIERLMCDLRVDIAAVSAAFDRAPDWAAEAVEALGELEADGAVALEGWTVTLAPEARALARIAASAFDAYLQKSAARHSAAV